MQLSQSVLFQLCCASFFAGILLSLFYDVLHMIRLWFTPAQFRYTLPKIRQMCPTRTRKSTKKKNRDIKIAVFFGDVFFCLVCAITLILLLFWLNNGAFRVMAVLCMAIGFYLCRISISKGVRSISQWFTFGVETVLHILFQPIKKLFAFAMGIHRKKVQKRRQKHFAKQRQIYTRLVLQNIDKEVQKLVQDDTKNRIRKGDNRARKSKKAV